MSEATSAAPSAVSLGRKSNLNFVLVCVFIDMLGVGLAAPVLPLLIGDFVKTPDEQAHWYGILIAVFGLMQFICMPMLGALSDKIGRKPVLLLSSAGVGINFLITAWAPSLAWLFVGRFIGGACSASMSVASAYASDVSTPENRAKTFGMIGAAFGVGFIVGPMLGGVLGSVNYHLPFYVGAALCAANVVFGYFFVTESLVEEKRTNFSLARANPFSALARLFGRRDIGGLIVVFALSTFAQLLSQTTWVLYMHFRFDWGPKENGYALFCVGLIAAVVQAGLLSRLIKWHGEIKLSLIGMLSGALALASYGLATSGWMIYVLILANLYAYAAGPAMQAISSKASDPREQGALMGSMQSLSSLSLVIAPLIGTQVLAMVSDFPRDDWRTGAPFFLAASFQFLAWLLAWRFFSRHGAPKFVPKSI